jgi:site-specific DNA-methyltransferase (adenine-specific)
MHIVPGNIQTELEKSRGQELLMIAFNQIIHADCMDIMPDIPDKYFELAIVDPPYGIGAGTQSFTREGKQTGKSLCISGLGYKKSEWDSLIPTQKYFNELYRISQDQIIWGGNYYIENLKNTSCVIIWDKDNGNNLYADCEIACTSFDIAIRKIKFKWHGMLQENMKQKEIRIHPTQKPIALYRWLLQNYAKPGDKIIDTHSGSGSLAIACHLEGFDFLAIEKDYDYWKDSVERYETEIAQGKLF